MTAALHRLSGICFYALGVSFFVAYICVRNDILAQPAAVWMQIADLPLALSAIVYAGISFYLSLTTEKGSKPLAWGIGVPLALFFVLLVVLNFWRVF